MDFEKMNISTEQKRAQSFLEYAIMMAMVVAAFAVMFIFFRNYTAGRIRSGADTIGHGEQYEPQ